MELNHERLNRSDLRNAIDKARRVKCFVRRIGQRIYQVITPKDHRYTVRANTTGGLRYLLCNCPAGSINKPCYHIIGVAHLDSALTGYGQRGNA